MTVAQLINRMKEFDSEAVVSFGRKEDKVADLCNVWEKRYMVRGVHCYAVEAGRHSEVMLTE